MNPVSMEVYLEEKKDRLLEDLSHAEDARRIQSILDQHLDHSLTVYNEQCTDPQLQELAARLTAAARSSLPLTDSTGEPRIWERTLATSTASAGSLPSGSGSIITLKPDASLLSGNAAGGSKGFLARIPKVRGLLPVVSLIGGILCLISALPVLFSSGISVSSVTSLPLVILMLLLGGFLLYLAGHMSSKNVPAPGNRVLEAQQTYDAQKIFLHLKQIVLTIDHQLQDAQAQILSRERLQSRAEEDAHASGTDEPELELYAALLEAACSGDGEYALEELQQVRHYLHQRKNIDLEDYSEEHRDWFERMPGARNMTLRPAMLRDGTLLKRGLALIGKEN